MKKIGLIIIVVFFIFYVIFQTHFGEILRQGNLTMLVDYLKSLGWIAWLISFIAILIQTFFPFIPFVILAGANALVFGIWEGFFMSWLFAIIGAIVAFFFSRYIAQEFAKQQTKKYPLLKKMEHQIKDNGFLIFLLGRLIPILPSSIVNFFGGISSLDFRSFFWSTFLGKLPMVFLETMMGHDIIFFKQHPKRLVFLILIFGTFIYLGYWINKRFTNKKIPNED
ncbi:TVP38/TMEM64 family protein [Tepidibacillus fermentans]|uniref:TVP38/TMEM64 family membrane protein n=1 Tax=Tepidibacillus fermentans TaxID=1281767 RepID=A0A4R3KDC0_9BACI|nr:TVP38/TMEM64 family protein [Tepidibacillus fermentans]TCS81266.1 putative membrane protein YdjX (TVP38/TMEM64 family) [Tepidibacillus fermentans]